MRMPHACDTHAKVPPSFYFIFTLKAEMITSCLKAHAKGKDPLPDKHCHPKKWPWTEACKGPLHYLNSDACSCHYNLE